MLTRRALLYRTAHAFAGAALASMMRWWPKQEEELVEFEDDEFSASIGSGYTTLTPEETPFMTIWHGHGVHIWVSKTFDPR